MRSERSSQQNRKDKCEQTHKECLKNENHRKVPLDIQNSKNSGKIFNVLVRLGVPETESAETNS